MKQYVIYLRVSTQRQGQSGLGLESQRDICLNYIKTQSGELLKEFQDVESGKSRTRPGLLSAVEFCKENNCTLVISKLDRLARDVEFTFKVINTGINIHFCDMPLLNTMVLGVFASVAQYERELISKRTKDALNAKKSRGEQWNTDRTVTDKARNKSAESKRYNAVNNEHNKKFVLMLELYTARNELKTGEHFALFADFLNKKGCKTSTGLEFNSMRARQMFYNTNKLNIK